MDRKEWQEAGDPAALLKCLRLWPQRRVRGTAGYVEFDRRWSPRLLRLFACACARLAWRLLPTAVQAGVRLAEGVADGTADPDGVDAAVGRLKADLAEGPPGAALLAKLTQWADVQDVAWSVATLSAGLTTPPDAAGATHRPSRRSAQADLVRQIFGDPFRPPLHVHPEWRTVAVLGLARAAYARTEVCRRCVGGGTTARAPRPDCVACCGAGAVDPGTVSPERLAVLSDALLEAGAPPEAACPVCADWAARAALTGSDDFCHDCGDTRLVPNPLLEGLRGPGPYYRGCAALDAVLGRG